MIKFGSKSTNRNWFPIIHYLIKKKLNLLFYSYFNEIYIQYNILQECIRGILLFISSATIIFYYRCPIASGTYLIVPIAIHDGMISDAITPTRAGTFTLRNSSHQENNFQAKKSERENGATSRDWLGLSAVPCCQLFLLYC